MVKIKVIDDDTGEVLLDCASEAALVSYITEENMVRCLSSVHKNSYAAGYLFAAMEMCTQEVLQENPHWALLARLCRPEHTSIPEEEC